MFFVWVATPEVKFKLLTVLNAWSIFELDSEFSK